MISKGIKYVFKATPWRYTGPTGWHFISMPSELANEIRNTFKHEEEGWGRMKACAKIGKTEWKTSIWYDTKHKTYLLPLKAEVRKTEKINTDKEIKITLWF